jgi:ABC-type lipoprotein export system ATPase subunit
VTIVVITHDTSIAAAADRRIELSDGRVITDTGGQPA